MFEEFQLVLYVLFVLFINFVYGVIFYLCVMYMYSFIKIVVCFVWLLEVQQKKLQVLIYGCFKWIIWIYDFVYKYVDDIFVIVLFWVGGFIYQGIIFFMFK